MAAAGASLVAQKLSAEQRLWKRLCRYHFSTTQIDFALKEAQKDKEKQTLPQNPLPIGKVIRSVRSSHPYLGSPRSSPVRTSSIDGDLQRKQVPYSAKKREKLSRNAFFSIGFRR